jgi:hypothetical protein
MVAALLAWPIDQAEACSAGSALDKTSFVKFAENGMYKAAEDVVLTDLAPHEYWTREQSVLGAVGTLLHEAMTDPTNFPDGVWNPPLDAETFRNMLDKPSMQADDYKHRRWIKDMTTRDHAIWHGYDWELGWDPMFGHGLENEVYEDEHGFYGEAGGTVKHWDTETMGESSIENDVRIPYDTGSWNGPSPVPGETNQQMWNRTWKKDLLDAKGINDWSDLEEEEPDPITFDDHAG